VLEGAGAAQNLYNRTGRCCAWSAFTCKLSQTLLQQLTTRWGALRSRKMSMGQICTGQKDKQGLPCPIIVACINLVPPGC
jgi:hypothetical protein